MAEAALPPPARPCVTRLASRPSILVCTRHTSAVGGSVPARGRPGGRLSTTRSRSTLAARRWKRPCSIQAPAAVSASASRANYSRSNDLALRSKSSSCRVNSRSRAAPLRFSRCEERTTTGSCAPRSRPAARIPDSGWRWHGRRRLRRPPRCPPRLDPSPRWPRRTWPVAAR